MWSDPRIWIPIMGVFVTISVTVVVHYLGNQEFRAGVQKALLWIRVILFRKHIFVAIYVPLLLLCYIVFYLLNVLTLTAGLIIYIIWITFWVVRLRNKKKNVSMVVSCRLGDENSEKGESGLILVRHEDGDSVNELFRGELVRRTNAKAFQNYIYFTFRDDVVEKFRKALNVVILIEFFDFGTEEYKGRTFNIQYDSKDDAHANPRFKTPNFIYFTGSNNWQYGLSQINDGGFKRRQQDKADFRIRRKSGSQTLSGDSVDLFIRRVVAIALSE